MTTIPLSTCTAQVLRRLLVAVALAGAAADRVADPAVAGEVVAREP